MTDGPGHSRFWEMISANVLKYRVEISELTVLQTKESPILKELFSGQLCKWNLAILLLVSQKIKNNNNKIK